MELVGDQALERSSVVANCQMNRQRMLRGPGGYARELGVEPTDCLLACQAKSGRAHWLDLCCGSGHALIDAATWFQDQGLADTIEIVGVDLVGMFAPVTVKLQHLQRIEASLTTWQPDRQFDLISCVHGWHYIGDKLGLLSRAASWLTAEGLLVGNLDLKNIQLADAANSQRRVAAELRKHGFEYAARRKLVRCRGNRTLPVPWRYLGADDRAGPNYTGQPAVNSHYSDLMKHG